MGPAPAVCAPLPSGHAGAMTPDELVSRELAEWDWVVTPSWRLLHAPKVFDDPSYDGFVEDGGTLCGRQGHLSIPGALTRMAARRCSHCCRITGMPEGTGSPKNDPVCRPVAEDRVRALRAC